MKVFVIGFPYDIDLEAECLDLVELWLNNGVQVTVLPVQPIGLPLIEKLTSIGCKLQFHLTSNIGRISENTEIRDSIVVGLYDLAFFTEIADSLRLLQCRLVWCGGPFLSESAKSFYEIWGPCDRIVIKSLYHRELLRRELVDYGHRDAIRMIKPPLCLDNIYFSISPHCLGTPFWAGRFACSAYETYYSVATWGMIESISCPVRGRWAEWLRGTHDDCPEWVELQKVYDREKFFDRLHCLVQVSGRKENWPRYALEAMASGVPIVAQNDSSWKELIRHGENGFICNSPAEVTESIDLLATDENFRVEMAIKAREYMQDSIDNDKIWSQWLEIFEDLQ